MRDQIQTLLAQLRFTGIAKALDAELDRAEREATPVTEIISRLLRAETAHRCEKSLAYRLAKADISRQWSLESFPFEQQPGLSKSHIRTLAGLDFLKRNDNILLIGEPGVGKSGIAIGLLREACLNGYNGCFYDAQMLFDELYTSFADRSTQRLIKRLSRFTPLVIDQLGHHTLKPEQVNAFFRLMDQRYDRASTIISTHLDFPAWYDLFQKKDLVDSLLDRLQHHCITIHINGPSLRKPAPLPSPVTTAPKGAPGRSTSSK